MFTAAVIAGTTGLAYAYCTYLVPPPSTAPSTPPPPPSATPEVGEDDVLAAQRAAYVAQVFEAGVAYVRSGSLPDTLSQETQLRFYGLYKQATEGDNVASQPSMLAFTKRAKWDAWEAMKGMSKMDAMKAYIDAVDAVAEEKWESVPLPGQEGSSAGASGASGGSGASLGGTGKGKAGGAKKSSSGPKVSTMSRPDDEDEDGGEGEGGDGGGEKGEEERCVEALADAIRDRDVDGFGPALEAVAVRNLVNMRGSDGLGALHVAADVADLEMVGKLLDAGADPNMLDSDGSTPLHYAVLYDSVPLAALLLERGARPSLEVADEDGTPADLALESGEADAFAELFAAAPPPT